MANVNPPMKHSGVKFKPFSEKQLKLLTWWCENSPYRDCDAVICDGAVRSGKTVCMTVSFVSWAFYCFSGASFALCGKTIASLRRNVTAAVLPSLLELGFTCEEKLSQNKLVITKDGRTNTFYLFGGRDESSASLIQGMTLSGVLFDEAALMPRSFVEQALARCSVDGSKFWFNCNPEHPQHWFNQEWILKAEQKNALYLHFTMDDNPALTPQMRKRYASLYSGAFYERFVLGKWSAAAGLVYPFFKESKHVKSPPGECSRYYLSCDYGTVNPFSCGLWGLCDGVWYRIREYYYDSRKIGEQKTDEEYYAEVKNLVGTLPIEGIIIDPSAASFLECVRRHGEYRAVPAKNDVLSGIHKVADALQGNKIRIAPACVDSLREFGLYRWDDCAGRDAPRKENDHAMDDIRYFVTTACSEDDGFFALAAERR